VLSATDVPCVRNTRKEVEALRQLSTPDQRWHFVLNRADARTGLNLAAIEKAVGLTLDVAIPSSRTVPVSLNQGSPLIISEPRRPVSLAMAQLVRRVAPELAGETGNNNGSRRKKKGI
jgi:pilus assembly protein CpaE